MTPRRYTLGKRAESAEATRQRILDAAVELYRELGVEPTTIKAVAERADVSRGTVLHHFGAAEGLLGAVLDRVLDGLEFPDPKALERVPELDVRIRQFVEEMVGFQDRTSHWWTMFESEMARPEVKQREATYWAWLADLQAAALGPELRDDARANATLTSMVHPATVGTFLWAFEQAGLPRQEGREMLGEFAVDAVRRIAGRTS